MPVGVRLSVEEYLEGGLGFEEAIDITIYRAGGNRSKKIVMSDLTAGMIQLRSRFTAFFMQSFH